MLFERLEKDGCAKDSTGLTFFIVTIWQQATSWQIFATETSLISLFHSSSGKASHSKAKYFTGFAVLET